MIEVAKTIGLDSKGGTVTFIVALIYVLGAFS
jgi:hypothetical protein